MMRIERLGLLFAPLALAAACKKEKEEPRVDAPKVAEVEPTRNAPQPPEPKRESGDQGGTKLIARIETCWGAFGAWDKETFRSCFADATEVGTVDGIPPNTMKSPQEVVVQAGSFRNAFADFKADLVLVLVNGSKVVALGLLSGTHEGGSLGIPPTHKPMSLYYAQVIEVDDQQRFVRERDYLDQTTLLHQLGVQKSQVAPASEQPWPERVRAAARNAGAEQTNIETFKASFEARIKGDFNAAAAQYADDAVFRYAPEAEPYTGRAEIAKATRDDSSQNTALEGAVRDAWAAGNWVVAETTVKGKIARPLAGTKGTKGKKWEENSLELLEFAGGKVKRHLVFANSLKFAVDVGLIDAASVGG